MLLIIRSANPKSREYRFKKGFVAKPSEAGGKTQRIKTGDSGMLLKSDVARHDDFGGEWKHDSHRDAVGFYSDYDIMCAWRMKGILYELIGEKEIGVSDRPGPLIDDLNEQCGWMFKHGANDYFLYSDRTRRNPPKQSDRYLAFNPQGKVQEFLNPTALSAYYRKLNLEHPYEK